MEILKSKFNLFPNNSNNSNNSNDTININKNDIESQLYNSTNSLFKNDFNKNQNDLDEIFSPNLKKSEYQIKRNKFLVQPSLLITNHSSSSTTTSSLTPQQTLPSSSINSPPLLSIPLNNSSTTPPPTGGPPQIKKVFTFCLSESIDLLGCYQFLESKGFKPQPFKNLLFFFIKKHGNSPPPPPPPTSQHHSNGIEQPESSPYTGIEMNKINHFSISPNLYGFSLDDYQKQHTQHNQQYQQSQDYSFGSNPTSPRQMKIEEFEKNHSLIVVYEYGCVVCWDLPNYLQQRTISIFDKFLHSPLNCKLVDEMIYDKGYDIYSNGNGGNTRIFKDQIFLKDYHYNTKLVISHSLSQSIRLSLIEENLNKLNSLTNNIPNQLVKKGSCGITHNQLGIISGSIFKIKNSISKNSLIFKSVNNDYFDQNQSNKSIYQQTSNYLDIKERTKSINNNIETINDMISICRTEIESKSSYRLEMTVIVLIAFELLFMVLTFVFQIDKIN